MHWTLPICPDNNIPHKGAIRKTNQCQTPQLIHNGIHTSIPDTTVEFIKPRKTCRNSSQPPLQSHLNWTIMWGWMYSYLWQAQSHSNKNKDIIIEVYQDQTNGLWWFPLHHIVHNNKQVNILEPHLCNHSIPMAPRHPRAYRPTSQQDLGIFYHQILCCPTKCTLLQAIKDGSFSTFPGLIEKLISK